MTAKRREFPKAIKVAIIKRATLNGVICCEQCGLPAKRFEIDHTVAEELQIDKTKRLTAADGRLLCGGPGGCHTIKTAKYDAPAIATARKREAKHLGASPPAGNIKNRGFEPSDKPKREKREPVPGLTGIARRFQGA